MIEYLSGTILRKDSSRIVIGVNGVGYGVEMPLSSLYAIGSSGQTVSVWIETHVREDAIKLFGFATLEEKEIFNILCSVSGVGPKIGLAILGSMQPSHVFAAVLDGRKELLESVPGIGKRLAERLAVELKPKLEKHLKSRPSSLPGFLEGACVAGSPVVSGGLLDQSSDGDDSRRLMADAQSALENLGFKDKDVTQALGKVWKESGASPSGDGDDALTSLIRGALSELRGW
jgi:Holliday junction DNA helicase RuvA